MLGLKDKNSPEEKVHGMRALTPSQWHKYKTRKPGVYQVVVSEVGGGSRSGQERTFEDAWEVFARAVSRRDCTPESGFRVRIVAVQR